MRYTHIATSLLVLLISTHSDAAQQICAFIGEPLTVDYPDVGPIGPRNSVYRPRPDSNCPPDAFVYSASNTDPTKHRCQTNAWKVKLINQFGPSDFGSCQWTTNVMTYECFAREVVKYTTGCAYGMCTEPYAFYRDTVGDVSALDCNNMQGDPIRYPEGGEWSSDAGSLFVFQNNKTSGLWGQQNTNLSQYDYNKCGTYYINGTLYPDGSLHIRLSNTNPPPDVNLGPFIKHCFPWVDYDGAVEQRVASGGWRNSLGITGPFRFNRKTLPMGVSVMKTSPALIRVSQTIDQSTVAPWVSLTPTPPPPTTLQAPTVDVPTQSDASSIILRWHSVPGASGFNVYARTPGAQYVMKANNLNDLVLNMESLTPNTQYHFVVTAIGYGLESAPSNEVTRTTYPYPKPFTIYTFLYNWVPGQLTIQWLASSNLPQAGGGYRIYRAPAVKNAQGVDTPGPWTRISPDLSPTTLSYTMSGVPEHQKLYFAVQAYNGNNQIVNSANIPYVTLPCATAKCFKESGQ